jgi:hypothetical protein
MSMAPTPVGARSRAIAFDLCFVEKSNRGQGCSHNDRSGGETP